MIAWLRRLITGEPDLDIEVIKEIEQRRAVRQLADDMFPSGSPPRGVTDLRSDEQKQWEADASASASLGKDLDALVEELRQIYVSSGFMTKSKSGEWNKKERVADIGEEIYDISGGSSGGLDAMLKVSLHVREQCGREAYNDLSLCWNRVREWLN